MEIPNVRSAKNGNSDTPAAIKTRCAKPGRHPARPQTSSSVCPGGTSRRIGPPARYFDVRIKQRLERKVRATSPRGDRRESVLRAVCPVVRAIGGHSNPEHGLADTPFFRVEAQVGCRGSGRFKNLSVGQSALRSARRGFTANLPRLPADECPLHSSKAARSPFWTSAL